MSAVRRGNLGVVTDVSGHMIQKLQMRYENTHDPSRVCTNFRIFGSWRLKY